MAKDSEQEMKDILHNIKDTISGKSSPDMNEEAQKKQEQTSEDTAEEELLELSDMDIVEEPQGEEDPQEEAQNDPNAEVDDIMNAIDANENFPPLEEEPQEEEPEQEESIEEPPQEELEEETSQEEEQAHQPQPSESLIKEDVKNASKSVFDNFVRSIPKPAVEDMQFRGGTSLEDLVIEAIKPMLAEWLNENLPIIVEEVVRKEIKKLLPEE